MTESQKKYLQSPKGKQAQLKATQNYQSQFQRWTGYFLPELSKKLEERFPGMSRNAILHQLAQDFLDND
jgi:hypothetical protein